MSDALIWRFEKEFGTFQEKAEQQIESRQEAQRKEQQRPKETCHDPSHEEPTLPQFFLKKRNRHQRHPTKSNQYPNARTEQSLFHKVCYLRCRDTGPAVEFNGET